MKKNSSFVFTLFPMENPMYLGFSWCASETIWWRYSNTIISSTLNIILLPIDLIKSLCRMLLFFQARPCVLMTKQAFCTQKDIMVVVCCKDVGKKNHYTKAWQKNSVLSEYCFTLFHYFKKVLLCFAKLSLSFPDIFQSPMCGFSGFCCNCLK